MASITQCSGCGASNKFLDGEDVLNCSYCGRFIEGEHRSNDLQMSSSEQIKRDEERKEMYNAIINDPLVRSVFTPKNKPFYIQLPMSFYTAFGLKGFAVLAFGLFVLVHLI